MDKKALLDFLSEVDRKLKRKITLVAAGGTALTLLDLKSSTIDIDFTGPFEDIVEFRLQEKKIPHGKTIDTYYDGRVFSQDLPNDYLDKSIKITIDKDYKIRNIELRSLHPLDIVVTKIGRYNERDMEDIENCIKSFKLTKHEITTRAEQVIKLEPGNEQVYRMKLEWCLKANYVDKL